MTFREDHILWTWVARAAAVAALCLTVSAWAMTTWADEPDPPSNVLVLQPTSESLYVRPGEIVQVDLRVLWLSEEVKACQAFLGYESSYLTGEAISAGGLDWDELIFAQMTIGGEVDMAVGVLGQTTFGTLADGTVATVWFRATSVEGRTVITFLPDTTDVHSTFLATIDAQPLWPTTLSSPEITIDGTPPEISLVSASQSGRDLLNPANRAFQGEVSIVVAANDALAGLVGPPVVTVTPNGLPPQSAAYVGQDLDGNYVYTWTVTPATPNGPAAIDALAADRAGNEALAASNIITVNKNRITGHVELQNFVGSSRDVIFTVTGNTTKTYLCTLTGFVGATAEYCLEDVPDGVTAVSAKTAWSLRRRINLSLDGQGQALGDFTDASKLLGGDLNASNYVNTADYVILMSDWYTTLPRADINGDGRVNSVDYTIIKWNWYKIGDPE